MSFFGQHPWWLLLFFAIGVLAALSGIVTLFFALGRRPDRMWTEEIGPVGSDDFLRPLAALLNVPVRRGGHAELLHNGDGWLPRLLADFAAAERSITFSAYIWEPGRMSDMVFDALTERARAGIQVRLLLDGLGGLRCPAEGIDRLHAAGARIERFRPLTFGKLSRFHRRNHRRAIVIDGRIGYTGGMAVGDKWLGNARNPDEWRDTMVRVTGCLAENLQSAFAELWANVTGEVLTAEAFFPDDVDEASDSRSMGVCSSPGSEEHPLRLFFFLTFLAARERLWITTPYFVPDEHVRRVVIRRARAGVDVRILMPNHLTDAKPIRLTSQRYYQELLDAGVRIFEYQPTMLHSKHVVVDGLWSVVGSANMDVRSKELNKENVLGILDADLARQLEAAFIEDLKHSREIISDEWRRRSPIARLLERGAAVFAEQY
ncbi:MAG TPA: phospholipase D-like domain-containing protein [Longimicrobiales bacterium]|nr:phospholipase D-like domain-containing protein [Longimicrobiales bacterium]